MGFRPDVKRYKLIVLHLFIGYIKFTNLVAVNIN